MCVICIVAENEKNVKFNRKKRGQTMPVRCVRVFGSPVQGEELYGTQSVSWASPLGEGLDTSQKN